MDDRPTTRIGDIVLDRFSHPQLSVSGAGKKAQLEILPESPDDDAITVIQPMGREAKQLTLDGTATRETATQLDDLDGEVVELRHARHSGEVYVKSTDTSPTGQKDEQWWYSYTLNLVEVT